MGALKPVKVGLIGCGAIAIRSYMPTILKKYNMIDMVKCADTVPERAALFAEKFGMKACTNEEIYNDPEIEVVLNLTYPTSHYEVTKAAIEHGKHVHAEKMMAVSFEQGQALAKLADEKGVWYTQAPDTFLGGAWQTARKLIDDGYIGDPIAVHCLVTRGNMILGGVQGKSTRREVPEEYREKTFAMMMGLPGENPRGPEGSGLPFDMGGYYLHNLINMFGNINRVSGYVKTNIKKNQSFDPLNELYKSDMENVEPDTLVGSLEFDNGVYGSIIFASGIDAMADQKFVVYGSQGTLVCPDPNYFGGPVYIQSGNGKQVGYNPNAGQDSVPMFEVPPIYGNLDESRGIGLVDLAFAIRNGRKPRCHYSMGHQAFEVVHGLIDSCKNNVNHKMVTKVERPKAVRPGFKGGMGGGGMSQQSYFDD